MLVRGHFLRRNGRLERAAGGNCTQPHRPVYGIRAILRRESPATGHVVCSPGVVVVTRLNPNHRTLQLCAVWWPA